MAADPIIFRGQDNGLDSSNRPVFSYEHGECQWALRLLYERTANRSCFEYIRKGVDNIVEADGTVQNYR